MHTNTAEIILWIVVIIGLASLIYLFSNRWKNFSFPLLLFVIGFFVANIGLIEIPQELHLNESTVLFIYLPILLFESAFKFEFKEFRSVFTPSFILATIGVILGIIFIALPMWLFFGIGFWESVLFGSIIASTDPIAVLSIFKTLGVPERLSLLVDSESFLNDATSVVIFKLILGILASGSAFLSSFEGVLDVFSTFFYVLLVGAAIGAILGWLCSEIISFIDDQPIIEAILTVIIALSSFIIAEEFGGSSGIVAVLATGLVLGNYGKTKISPKSHVFIDQIWEQLGFVTTSLVFILIGFEVELSFFTSNIPIILTVILILNLGRIILIKTIIPLFNGISNSETRKISTSWQWIMSFSGLRGVLPLVLVLSLPEEFIYRELFLQLVIASIAFSIIINTPLIQILVHKLNLQKLSPFENVQKIIADIVLHQKMFKKLEDCKHDHELNSKTIERHKIILKEEITQLKLDLKKYKQENNIQIEQLLRQYFIQVEKSSYHSLYNKRIISVDLYERLVNSLNVQLERIRDNKDQFTKTRIKLEEKRKKLNSLRFNSKAIFHKIKRSKHEHIVSAIYLYYKARIIGNENVLVEINNFKSLESNIFKDFDLNKIEKTYKKLLKENLKIIEDSAQYYPEIIDKIEDRIYEKELHDHCEKLKHKFIEEGKISSKAGQALNY